jgi:hypothetical protein
MKMYCWIFELGKNPKEKFKDLKLKKERPLKFRFKFLEVRDFMFFRWEKHIISHFAGFLRGPRLF